MASQRVRCASFAFVWLFLGVQVFASLDGGERLVDTPLKLLLRARGPRPAAGQEVSPQRAGDILFRLRRPATPREGRRSTEAGLPRLLLIVKYVGEEDALAAIGFQVQGRIGTIYTGSLDSDRLADLAGLPGVVFVQSSRRLVAPPILQGPGLATSGAASAERSEAAVREGTSPRNLTGAGALIGYVDTGVDVFHQDFRTAGGATRIKYLLDFSDPGDTDGDGDLDGPGPFGGTLYTEAQINAALSAGSIGQRDTTGHGTHGLSAAAGDDPDLPGVAPAADLVVVKATREDGTLGFESADVINALAFVDEKATELGRPYVANLSLGTIVGSHDGRSLEEQAIDTLVGPGIAGKTVVVAAGNASDNRGTHRRHFRGTAYTELALPSNTHTLVVPAYTANPERGNDRVVLNLWQKGRDQNRITVTGPGCAPVVADFGDYQDVQTACGDVFIANMGGASPLNGDVESVILIDDWSGTPPLAGTWTITVTGQEVGDTGVYDGWLGEESVVGATSPYLTANADNLMLVGKPGGAYNAITVGSQGLHDDTTRYRTSWTDVNLIPREDTSAVPGDISDFSSPGGTRDGRVKPEVVAPGERVMGAVSRDAMPAALTSIYRFHPFPEADALLTDDSENHAFGMLQGTSFAAPVVSGLVARILAEDPSLDAIQVRNILINSATVDAFVTAAGTVPNPIWGYGKVLRSVGGGAPLPSSLRITTDTVPSGVLNEPYEIVFTAAGGTLPYTWSRIAGAFPPGLSLSGSLLSGTPTAPAGTYNFTMQVQDAAASPRVATHAYSLVVAATSPLLVTTPGLPPARVSRPYTESFVASGGTPPYTWDLVGGSLPAGLSLTAGGIVQGTPAAVGKSALTVRVTDAGNVTAYRSVTLRVLGLGGDDWTLLGYFAPEVTQIAVDPNDSNRLFAATEQLDGIFVTTDGGETWRAVGTEKVSLGGQNRSAERIRISPATSDAFIVETGYEWTDAQNENSRWTEQVLRYDPVADDWVLWGFPCAVDYPPIPMRLDALDVDSAGAVNVLSNGITCPAFPAPVDTEPRLLRSTNQGVTWTSPGGIVAGGLGSNANPTRGSMSVAASDPSRMYVSRSCRTVLGCNTPEGTFTSANGGVSWTDVSGGVTGIVEVRASAANPLDVVRAGSNFVERSLNGGTLWTRFTVPVGGGTIQALDRGTSAPQLVLVGATSGLFKSEDHGQTWAELRISGRAPSVTALTIDPSNDDRLWVADAQGIFVSVDRGATWSLRTSGLVQRELRRLAINPSATQELVLTGTGGPYLSRSEGQRWVRIPGGGQPGYWLTVAPTNPDRYYSAPLFYGLWRSDNRGVTWYQPNPSFGTFTVPPGEWIAALGVSPFDEDTLLVNLCVGGSHSCQSQGAKLYRSTDGGVNWTPLPGTGISATARIFELVFAQDVSNRVYLATSAGVYRSTDGGTTWSLYGGGVHPTFVQAMAVAPSNSNYVYAGGSFFNPAVGSWQSSAAPSPFPQSIAIHPQDPMIAYAAQLAGSPTTFGLFKTTNGGQNWTAVTAPFVHMSVMGVAVDPSRPDVVYAATRYSGVFRSEDAGATWEELSEYGTVADVVNVNVEDPSNPNLLLAGTEGYGVQASTNRGLSYVPRVDGLTNIYVNAVSFDPGTPSTVYAATEGGLFKSTNSGGTWAPTTVSGRVTDIATHNDGVAHRVWATVAGEGVAYSGDTGTTFTVYSSGLESLQLSGLAVESLGTAHRVWATTSGGSGVTFSDDSGQTWRSAAGNGLTDRDVSDLAVSGGTAHRVWATTAGGVFFSADVGTTWNNVSLGLPSGVPITSVAVDPNSQEVLVSLSSKEAGGVFRGASATGVWTAYNRGLDELRVRNVSSGSPRTLSSTTKAASFYAATSGAGVFASELRTVASNPPAITTVTLPDGTVRTAYGVTFAASGGTPPYTWSVVGGSPPPGLTLDPASGQLAGAPGEAGTFGFTVQVADVGLRTASRVFSLRILDPTPRLSAGDVLVGVKPTGSVTARIPVTLSPASTESVSVSYGTADGTAKAGTHYAPVSGGLTFAPGQVSREVPVSVIGGSLPAGQSRSFYLNLSNPVNAPLARGQGIATLVKGDLFYTLSPCRLVDTRAADAPALAGGTSRVFTLRGRCGVPLTAKALSLNITVTSPSTAGHLTLFPTGGSVPLASSINFAPGQTRANNAILRLDSQGRVTVASGQASGTVHLILDVNGYLE